MAARLAQNAPGRCAGENPDQSALNRLADHALGDVELSATQVSSIEMLLKKVLPDLQAVELSGDEDNPVEVITRIELIDGDGED
jgi:hypothetical protein